jgi:hypothetical protein
MKTSTSLALLAGTILALSGCQASPTTTINAPPTAPTPPPAKPAESKIIVPPVKPHDCFPQCQLPGAVAPPQMIRQLQQQQQQQQQHTDHINCFDDASSLIHNVNHAGHTTTGTQRTADDGTIIRLYICLPGNTTPLTGLTPQTAT